MTCPKSHNTVWGPAACRAARAATLWLAYVAASHGAEIVRIGVPGYLTGTDVVPVEVVVSTGDVPVILQIDADIDAEVLRKQANGTSRTARLLTKRLESTSPDGAAVTCAADVRDVLAGKVRITARLTTVDGDTLALAKAPPTVLGIRARQDLAGDWAVSEVRPIDIPVRGKKEAFKPGDLPTSIALPGTLDNTTLTSGFRGWVTLRRTVRFPRGTDLRPGRLVATGVMDSIRVTANGHAVGELLPEAELDHFLSHWPYFHGQRLVPALKDRPDMRRWVQLLSDMEAMPPFVAELPEAATDDGVLDLGVELRGTSGTFQPKPAYGIHGQLYAELVPGVWIRQVTFDATKPDADRRFTFTVSVTNETDKPFKGDLRCVYGQYSGTIPYTGPCLARSEARRSVAIPPGTHDIQIIRDEEPRFATCRATFVLMRSRRPIDADAIDYHTVAVKIRNRRDLYVNNERFFVKGRGSHDVSRNQRFQLLVNGCNMRRGITTGPSHRFPGLLSRADWADAVYAEGLLHDTGPLVASCEKCEFWNPADTSNIERAVRWHVNLLYRCPGIIQWEATNELHGEVAETRRVICDLFRKLDPYHRPVVMTKGGGEWEAEAELGRVAGPDIVGVQYLGTTEAVDSILATITEQPVQSTEINWNDPALTERGVWEYGLEHGVCGALLFDYSGHSTDQGVPAIPAPASEQDWSVIRKMNRDMYQDLTCHAVHADADNLTVTLANRMPYMVRNLRVRTGVGPPMDPVTLAPGQALQFAAPSSALREAHGYRHPLFVLTATYTTHGGLPHTAVLSEEVK